ncbi:hypothetical protein PGA7_00005310 [Porphyromonas gingivalis]|nr:hypothetical protein PGA7_00005310 [Porphyromonas gingivalis]
MLITHNLFKNLVKSEKINKLTLFNRNAVENSHTYMLVYSVFFLLLFHKSDTINKICLTIKLLQNYGLRY